MTGPLRCAFAAAWIVSAVIASAASGTNSAWSVHVWQSDDGLPNNSVTGLAQTGDGYLWVATLSKPARFDGVRFEEFVPQDFAGLTQKITAVLSVSNGLWMGMDHGQVVFLNSKTARVFTNGLPERVPQALTDDAEGAVWVTYRGGTVYRIKDDKVSEFTALQGLPSGGYVTSLTRDSVGRIWFARNGFVGWFRDGSFVVRSQLPKVATRLSSARGGGVWVCSGTQLLKCDTAGEIRYCGTFIPEQPASEPTALLEDSQGGVWIGTSDSGLFRFDGSRFEKILTRHRAISSLLEDHEGNLWVGTDGGGLNRVHLRALELETTETGLPFETIQSICEDAAGTVWATTINGLLIRRNGAEWSTISTNADWPGGRATCVVADPSGGVWVGTKDRALHCLRDGRFSSVLRSDGLESRTIHALLVSAAGDLWIGEESPDIVQRLRRGKLETFRMPEGIRIIRAMAEDTSGDIWVGSSKGYLVRIHDGQVLDETARMGPVLKSIRSLHATPDGILWLGLADEGMGWISNGRFEHVTSKQGLADDRISQVTADGLGWLWFGGDHGIFKVRQQELQDLAGGRRSQIRSVRYGASEGLRSLQANFGDAPGTLRSRDGRLWMPMRTALVVVDPGKLREDLDPPRVLLKRMNADDKVMAWYGGAMPVDGPLDLQRPSRLLRLLPGHRRLEFEFTALNFSAPENVRFSYWLEGFDENWIDAGTQRGATYSRLPAGNYWFHVKACNGDGVWNEAKTAFAFAVAPFFWQTWWFRSGGAVLVIGIVRYVSFRRLRLKLQMLEQQTALEQERVRIAKDLHDDLGTRLTKVVLLSGIAQRDPALPPKAAEHLARVSTMAQQVIKSLDETVWAVNPRNDTLPHLVDYIGQFAVDFLQTAEIRCRPDLPQRPPDRIVLAKARHNLFLTVKEALNNVVRHSNATDVQLRIDADEQSLKVAIEDNGRGFTPSGEKQGDGLRNMRQRMEEIGGECRIESKPGGGTRIALQCPWKNGG